MNTETPFEKFLNQHDEEAWSATLATLLRSIHEVDRNATQIWFAFYPLSLFRALQQADERQKQRDYPKGHLFCNPYFRHGYSLPILSGTGVMS